MNSVSPVDHPLGATLARISMLHDMLNVELGTPSGKDWIPAVALVDDTHLRDELMTRIGRTNRTSDRHVITMSFWTAYTWQLIVGSIACYLVEQRVPDCAPEEVMVHWDHEGWADRLAWQTGRFTALPDDPHAGHPDVKVVPDRTALRAALIEQITRCYGSPMLDALVASSPLGKRALWAAIADRCAGTIIVAAKTFDQPALCRAEVDAMVCDAPLRGKTGVLVVAHNGREELFLERGSCCYSYKLPDHEYCTTCPLQPATERLQRLRASMADYQPEEL